MSLLIAVVAGTLAAGTPFVLAALGELITERAGVLNLGVEGMMLVGAVAAFVGASHGGMAFGVVCGAAAGAALSLIFGVITLTLMANQVATGLALTIFGIGFSAFVGRDFIGASMTAMRAAPIPWLSDLPVIGPALFSQDPLVYTSILLCLLIHWIFFHTKAGLRVRAVGESPQSAHALGLPVIAIRYACTLLGGTLAGLAGAYLAIVYTPMWMEQMTAGRGWIALALVVFANWRPLRVLVGAYLFGGVTLLQFHAQGLGVQVPSQLLAMLPYAATIMVLIALSRDPARIRINSPASLGKPFHAAD